MKVRTGGIFIFWVGSLLLLTACKKEKVYNVKGRLLLSRSQPVPVLHYGLSLYQRGSGGAPIALGVSSSIAEGKTDENGYFQIRFKEGEGTFFGIPTRNGSSVTLSGSDALDLPNFRMVNFPLTAPGNAAPLYLYKKVDTVFVKLRLFSPVSATDSFTIYANSIRGGIRREKTGFTAAANSEILIDTITEATFSFFDFATNKYVNDVSVYKKGNFMQLNKAAGQDSLSTWDEQSLVFTFNLY